jgi:hypothetical protein
LVFGANRVTATVHRVAFPTIGPSSFAYARAFTFADLGAPRTAAVEAFARAAAAKAQTGSTAPVPDSVSIASTRMQTAHTRLGAIAHRAIGSGPPLC